MNGKNVDGEAFSKITPRALRAYVAANGWRKVEPYGNVADVYAHDDAHEILVPISSHFADYTIRMWQVVGILADVEEREQGAVLRDLLLADVNLVRVRLPDAGEDGSVPLDTGLSMIEKSRNMLLAAARSASDPQRVFKKLRTKEVKDYVSDVRFGQTERGSFVINILSPVIPQSQMFSTASEPFPQRVVHTLASGLQATRSAVDIANLESDFSSFEDGVSDGVSANMCEALGGMLGLGGRSGIDISVSWALTYSHNQKRVRVRFDEADAPVLTEACRVLKGPQEPPVEHIEGYVNSLVRGESDYQGSVRIRGMVSGSMNSIRVDFSHDDYDLAITAHAKRQMISVKGDLRREGQRWVLDNPRDLRVKE